MKQKTWITAILVGTVAVNAVAYVIVRSRRGVDALPTPVTETTRPAPAAAAPAAVPAAAPEEDAHAGLARARRAAGLAALEDRDYDTAVAEFTEALRLRKDDKGDLVELLRIAADLRTRGQARTRDEEPKPSRNTPAKSKAVRLASARTPAREEAPAPAAASEEESTKGALLLVTSTPPGLVVMVDGKTVDLTPARIPLRAGTYRVALAQGERKLAEETVELGDEDVRSLNRDLSAELAPPPSRTAPTPAASPSQVAAPAPAPAAPAPVTPPAPTSVATAAARGDLNVTSPSLYGEVWINNRPYGFPPVLAQGLPAGPARVEVRVNGVVKRKLTVEVEPGRSTPVRVR
ncbi:MAG TPA: PEGA domain-containing protein [Myxococcus sp.]|nr:PEGA domain-containing protein [Myxococcus sp.]